MTRATLLAACAVVALAVPARAHRLHVEARVEGGRVRVDVYFSDGTAPAGAQLIATRDGVEVARGETDAAGVWTFTPQGAGRYEVSVTEPGLHRGKIVVDVREVDLAAVTSSVAPTPTAPPATERGGVEWGRTLVGLLVIALLAVGLAAWQRRRTA